MHSIATRVGKEPLTSTWPSSATSPFSGSTAPLPQTVLHRDAEALLRCDLAVMQFQQTIAKPRNRGIVCHHNDGAPLSVEFAQLV